MNPQPTQYEELKHTLDTLQLIDTHEHIPPENRITTPPTGFFDFFQHYLSTDLISAGMSRQHLEAMRDPNTPLTPLERWRLIEPWWPFTQSTGYGRAFQHYIHQCFGFTEISAHSITPLDQVIRAAHQPGWYKKILHDTANIQYALVITWPGESVEVDQHFFRAVPILDHFALATTRAQLHALEEESNCAIQSLTQLEHALENRLQTFVHQGIAAVKIFQAYQRPLFFEKTERATAARCFDRLWLSSPGDLSFDEVKPLQDYITWKILALTADHHLPIQIHTGIQEGNGNYLENARPTLLTNCLLHFADLNFDLFHAGFPYAGETAVLAKTFPNAYADLCWLHALAPTASERILHDWLDLLPHNKILGFGGDSNYVEGACGHAHVARNAIHRVLSQKIDAGAFTETQAITIAQRILQQNARELFKLPGVLNP